MRTEIETSAWNTRRPKKNDADEKREFEDEFVAAINSFELGNSNLGSFDAVVAKKVNSKFE